MALPTVEGGGDFLLLQNQCILYELSPIAGHLRGFVICFAQNCTSWWDDTLVGTCKPALTLCKTIPLK